MRDDAAPARPRPERDRWRWLTGGALAGCAATMLAWVVGTAVIDWRANEDVAVEAVATHVRATLERPSDRGRIIGPAHGQAVAVGAARLFAAGT